VYSTKKTTTQALLYFNSAALLAPENIATLVSCAETLLNLNRGAEAAIYSQRALQLRFAPNILTLHAKALYQSGEYGKALDCFEKVIAEEPSNYIALSQRALCLTQVNRYDEAHEMWIGSINAHFIITIPLHAPHLTTESLLLSTFT